MAQIINKIKILIKNIKMELRYLKNKYQMRNYVPTALYYELSEYIDSPFFDNETQNN